MQSKLKKTVYVAEVFKKRRV